MGMFPITQLSYDRITVVDRVLQRWMDQPDFDWRTVTNKETRVGFFDGGSRGNPGPGGSGSIIVAVEADRTAIPLWAAATALGRKTMTNNIAEFIGLHRLLARAVEKNWVGIHVVGDSALILRMMSMRIEPNSRRLKHWYRVSRRLADQCQVGSWTHHYRRYNKTADWLANYAMDNGRSVMIACEEPGSSHEVRRGVEAHIEEDLHHFVTTRGYIGWENAVVDELEPRNESAGGRRKSAEQEAGITSKDGIDLLEWLLEFNP